MMNFNEAILGEVFANFSNDYTDNWDYSRYGDNEPAAPAGIRHKIQKLVNQRGYYPVNIISQLFEKSLQVNKFEFLYNNLETPDDKKLLLQVLAYRILGYKKVKLPLNTPEYFIRLKSLDKLSNPSDSIDPGFMHLILNKLNLNSIGYPIEFYFTEGGVMIDFIIKQYEYNKNGVIVKAEKGDYVVDGGGCWGDTALFFANEAGRKGKVFSFEFIPKNIDIFETNVALNANLKNNIEIVRHPLWNNSDVKVYYKDFGPGSRVGLEPFEEMDGYVETLSIDDLVAREHLTTLDFIKLDIEGAEMNALRGAENSIKKFKPKLAVALYHSEDDFNAIPRYIKELSTDYKFYFSHCTMNSEESILFAKAD